MSVARLALVSLLAVGCLGPTAGGLALDHTQWRAVRIVGREPVPGKEPTILFDGDTISGSAGCNGYGARQVTIEDGRIAVGELGMTAMLCGRADGDLMRREDDFFFNLRTATTIGMRDGRLVIMGGTGELVFERAGPIESLQ